MIYVGMSVCLQKIHISKGVSRIGITVFPRLERARSINYRLAPRGVVFEGAL